jgi:hypothetical protein
MPDNGLVIDAGLSIEMDMSQTVSVMGDLSYPLYSGPYDATPTVDGMTLATKRRSLSEDVTVEPIPIGSVSNASGGRTVTIG